MSNQSNHTVCNICGNKFDMWDAENGQWIHGKLGYGSLYDEDNIDLHICCKCFDNIIKTCKVNPIISTEGV